jgi:hypothetical protein
VRKLIPVFLIGLAYFLAGACTAFGQNEGNVFISDVTHFWIAFDSLQTTKDTSRQIEIMQSLYIDKGTMGLKTFMQLRNFNADTLVQKINKYPKFWKSIRNNTLSIQPEIPVIASYLPRFKELYPDFKPAKIFFTITAIRSAGTVKDSMVLIGSEITMGNKYTDVSEFPDKRLANFFKPKDTADIVPIAIHEYTHTQQKTEGKTLLGQSLNEGACDFIAELVIHKPLTHSYLIYGRNHEQQLKQQFKKEMFAEDESNWLYNGATTKTMGDLGYFMGYAICKSYYRHMKNKQLAIKHIIELDYANLPAIKRFLAESKYY